MKSTHVLIAFIEWDEKMIIQVIGILLLLLGLIVIAVGILLWKKQKIQWVSVHSDVKGKDVSVFTKMVGQSTIGIGISVGLWGCFWIMRQLLVGPILFVFVFIISIIFYFKAQKLYD